MDMFLPRRIDQVYCNNLCRQRAYLERKDSDLSSLQIMKRRYLRPHRTLSIGQPETFINHTKPVPPLGIDIEDYDDDRDLENEKRELREEIRTWITAVIKAIRERSIGRLKELQASIKVDLLFDMHYDCEHFELRSPMMGLNVTLEMAIDAFTSSDQAEDCKWYFLELEFYDARMGCFPVL